MNILDTDDIKKVQEERDKLSEAERRKTNRIEHNAEVFEQLTAYTEELLSDFAEQAKGFAEPEQMTKGLLGFGAQGVYAVRAPKTEFGMTDNEYVWAWVTEDGKGYGRFEKQGKWGRYYPKPYSSGLRTSDPKPMVTCPMRAVAEYLTGELIDEESTKWLSLEDGKKELKGVIMTALKNL
ncbi:MAG: hypothetical protein FWD72_01480 [Eggerthellaceae bacterium]|nr:hypothetical protein [Eggerthellaceae bacterium]